MSTDKNRQAELRLDGIDSFDGIGSEFLSVVRDTKTTALVTRNDGYSLAISADDSGSLSFTLNSPEGVQVGGGKNIGSALDSAANAHHRAVAASSGPVVEWDQDTDILLIEETQGGNPYQVPLHVKDEITQALSNITAQVTQDDLDHANTLAYGDSASLADVMWIADFFAQYDGPAQLHGGHKGKKWAEKILGNIADGTDPSVDSDDEDDDTAVNPLFDFQNSGYTFYAIGDDENTTEATALLAVDFEAFTVFGWGANGFTPLGDTTPSDIDEPLVLIIDAYTAETLAQWINDEDVDGPYEILDTDPEERNLFLMADSEIDYEQLGMLAAIVADATGYTPAERSVNSSRQARDGEGHFNGEHVKQGTHLGDSYAKARLEQELPLVTDHAKIISDWLTDKAVAVTAAGEEDPEADTPVQNNKKIAAPKDAEKKVAPEEAGPNDKALYFGLVDSTDKTAVIDAVAITKDGEGNAQGWKRENGKWVSAPKLLADLQGATPPPAVELFAPEPLKNVLAQIDKHDEAEAAGVDTTDTPLAAAALGDALRGYSLSDGSYAIHTPEDLQSAVQSLGMIASGRESEVVRHLKKRARAMNRMDLIPEELRPTTLVEMGEEMTASSSIYGEYGEVLVAATTEGAGGGAKGMKGYARLKAYWCHGAGAAKIGWGTPGDLTRAHALLSKYVGPAMAWGLAQNYHKSLFGMSNATHDKITGQTPHKGK